MNPQNHRTFWAGRDPEGPSSPAQKWMAHRGIEPKTLALLAQRSNQPHPFYLADSTYCKFLTSYWFLILVEMVFIRTNCNLTYLCFSGLKIACLGCWCLPGLTAESQITIKHTWKDVFHLRQMSFAFFRFQLLIGVENTNFKVFVT